ncbi:hypothetical protein G195_000243 [Phytophthora kernoviae 00238/432]|uniref:Aldehyde oxidase/xanthine dehydrogenase a/b hammerhead domain-containing protein n=1 Tax=Phytophthora kernoviae 00238/432 TaxID=1284355 RepID=A0A8J4SE95_9STRA|nr:hypothetical protein G195_000243 [Phytophthora kernoviae 00238/432]
MSVAREISFYRKLGRREAFTASLVTIAFHGEVGTDGRWNKIAIAAGGGSGMAMRLPESEKLLLGSEVSIMQAPALAAAVMSEFVTYRDAFATEQYRKQTADMTLPGMLHGRVLRSAYPYARILSIDITGAAAMEGVFAVLTSKDVPGLNRFGIATPDQPVFCEKVVRYVGDAIAAVAADSPERAALALEAIRVEYEEWTPLDSPEAALAPGAPELHEHGPGNVLHRTEIKRGHVDEGFAACEHIVTTQHGYKDRMQLARIIGCPEEDIRVVSSPIGGSFGGKDELNVQPYGALLALRSGRPVKMHNFRKESVRAGLKRHPMKIEMQTGISREGMIQAHRVRITADTGAYATLGAPVLNFCTEHCLGPYSIPHVDVEDLAKHGEAEEWTFDTHFEYPTTPDNVVGGHYLYTYAAVAAEVEVNTLTGEAKLLDTKHVVAAGPVINPMGFIGQIEGGSVMALGFTLTEDALMQDSRYMTTNLDTYLIPTIRDIHTNLEVEAIEDLPEGDPFGPRGIGEIGSVALAPAITAAIHQATGPL